MINLLPKTVAAVAIIATSFLLPVQAAETDLDSSSSLLRQTTHAFSVVDPEALPYSVEPRTNYAITLGGGKGVLISPSWVLTASHVITWDKQKDPWKLSMRFAGRDGEEYRAAKVFRHPGKDLALVQLRQPILQGREPVLLMRDIIGKGQKVTVKKVTEGRQDAWKNLPARGGRQDNLYISKGQRKGGAGTSGSPWLVESPLVGDVLVGITHGSGRAPQVAAAKGWIDKIVSTNTPDEQLHWATMSQVKAQAPVVEASQRSQSLIVLP